MTDVPVLNALIFACLGIGVFVVAFAALAKIAPFDVWKQIIEFWQSNRPPATLPIPADNV